MKKPSTFNPLAVQVLHELNLDISCQKSKHIDTFPGKRFAYVVTVCDEVRDACPILRADGKNLYWSFDDPADAEDNQQQLVHVFRRVRDEIANHIVDFI